MNFLTAIAVLTEKAFQTYLIVKAKLTPFGFKSVIGRAAVD
jgi:hypothetical protein